MCPSSNPGKSYCNVPYQYYCSCWGCETIASGWKVAKSEPFLKTSWGPTGCTAWTVDGLAGLVCHGRGFNRICDCQYIFLNVTNENDLGWTIGKTWGIRYWLPGADRGGMFFIKKQEVKSSTAIGPNVIIKSDNQQRKESFPTYTPLPTDPLPTKQIVPSSQPNVNSHHLPNKPFFNVLDAIFRSLNQSDPDLTSSCWLCYDVYPRFYEGIALNAAFDYSSESSPTQCRWDTPRKGITLNQVRGLGVCFGNTTLASWDSAVCAETVVVDKTRKWAIPSAPRMWICHQSGVTPCVSLELFDDPADFV